MTKSKIEETLLIDDQYFAALIDAIQHAKKTIDLEVYIFDNDQLGLQVAEALMSAAKRGVHVRVLVDGMGSPRWDRTVGLLLEQAGIETRVYQPLPWLSRKWLEQQSAKAFFEKIIYLLFRINRRNHRKTCVIDSKIAFIGSANITSNHREEQPELKVWRDTSVWIMHTDMRRLKIAFENVWNHFPLYERAKYSFQNVPRNPIFRLNFSRHQRRELYKDLLKRIRKSRKCVWISNAYFMPNAQLLNSLIDAAKNGIDVKIILSQKSDIRFYPLVTKLFYTQLIKAGVKIYEYIPSILHTKTVIIDEFYLIGSSNLNNRSLLHDLEIDVMLTSRDIKNDLNNQFKKDLEHAQLIQLNEIKKIPKITQFFAWLLLYLRYWL